MAKNTLIYLRIGEGKDLPPKDLSGKSDPYCAIKVDNEVVARTATVWRDLHPFWGEEFAMFLPGGFTNLSITVLDEDTFREDDRIGKITFTREVLTHCPRWVEKWFPLSPAYTDDDIQGELRIETTVFVKGDSTKVKVKIVEARDLPEHLFHDTTGPFVHLMLTDKQKSKEMLANTRRHSSVIPNKEMSSSYFIQLCSGAKESSSVSKRTRFPKTQEVFEFESKSYINELKILAEVQDRVDSRSSLGEAVVFLSKHVDGQTKDLWYKLFPTPHQRHRKPENIGSIRLKVSLMEEYVLPSVSYQPLMDLISEPVTGIPTKGVDAISIMEDMATLDHACVARQMVKIFIGQNSLLSFLDWITNKEIQRTTSLTTLFRGNSLASKAVEQFLKIVGMPYLYSVLKPTIDRIFEEHKVCELDPCRVEKPKPLGIRRLSLRPEDDTIARSILTIRGYLDSIMTSIFKSVQECPVFMRIVFRNLARRVYQHFGEDSGNEDLKYLAISGFFFLRFFAPAILGPKLFSLRDHHADKITSRTLTLLAKIVQKISNLESQVNTRNEVWMAPLAQSIELYSEQLRDFFDRFMDVDDSQVPGCGHRRSVFDQSVIIKEGYLKKCRFNIVKLPKAFVFKKRYCWLSTENFLYGHAPDAQTRQFLPTHKIVAVEKVDDCAFQKSNVFQVVSEEYEGALQTLYLSCQDVNEMNQWMSAIRKTVVSNPRVLTLYHSGVYHRRKWKCCGKVNRACTGCSRSNGQVILSDWRDPLDPDAEIQMLYTQLFLSRDELQQKFLEGSTGGTKDERGECKPRDDVRAAVANLLDVIDKLYESHRAFEKKAASKAKS